MSVDPLTRITEWKKNNWPWKNIYYPVIHPFTVAAGQTLKIPTPDNIYHYPEGILLSFGMITDHPKLGLRVVADPLLDTKDQIVLNTLGISGAQNISGIFQTALPPASPPGIYAIYETYPSYFENTLELDIINTDAQYPHTVFMYLYQMIVLIEKKPREAQ